MRQVLVETARRCVTAARKSRPMEGATHPDAYFAGMTAEEAAMVLSMPVHVVRSQIRLAKAWLRKE